MDLRFALRYLRRNPGFSIGAIVVLALGMGANTAIFSIINAVLIRPLDYPNADRIVAIEPLYKRSGKTGATASAPDFHDLRKQNTTLEAMAYYVGGEASSVVNGQAIYASSWYVTPEFFKVFALPASFGRLLGQHEDKGSVVVVSHAWAQRHFADPRRALGQSLKVRGQIVEVVGVAAPGFHYPAKADIWMPGGLLEENSHRTAHNYIVVGRLKPHVQLATAAEDLRVIADRLERQYPENRDKSVAVTPLQNQLTNSVQSTLWVLLGAVGLVLLIACANVANLLVARAGARTREIALRSAVGASRLRLVRQLVTESLLLALFGSAAGILLAVFALDALLFLAPANVPRLEEVSLDWTVLIFSVALAFVCSLLFGLAPALQASRVDLTTALRAGGGKGVVGGGGRTTRSVLVVAEVALSVILLVGAGLLLRSYHALSNVDLGFATERIIVTHLSTSASTEEAARRVTQFYRRLIENVGAVPGIASIAGVFSTPLGDTRSNAAYFIQGRPEGRPGEYPFANMQVVTPRYFETMGVRILQGRDFTNADEAGRHQVVIVNEAFVRQAFPSGRTLGQRVRSGFTQQSAEWMEIIGVVRDVRARNPGVPAGPEMYLPYLQHPGPGSRLSVVARTTLEPSALEAGIRSTISKMDSEIPIRFQTMEAMYAQSLSYPRFRTLLIGLFAIVAATLAAIGIYSVLAYVVTQRTAEIGVRMALGADRSDVVRLVVADGLRLTGIGLVLGMVGALGASRLLSTLVFGVSPSDPATYIGALLITAATAMLASTLPGLRAAKVDPVTALRQD